jgi:tetratricopeptide (TPR) repeat protein
MRRQSTLLIALGLLVAVAICYRALPDQEFLDCWDDGVYVTNNRAVTDFDLRSLLTRSYGFTYHPLTMLTLALEYQIWGERPLPFKLTNTFLHLASSVLVVLIVWRLFPGHVGLGVFSGFVFAVHPQHVESVAWVAQRKDVLSTVLALLSLWLYLGARGGGGASRFRDWRYQLSLLCFLLALLAKAMVVTLPVILLLVDFYRSGRITRDDVFTKLPHFALSLLFGVISLISQVTPPSSTAAYATLPPFTFIEAIAFYAWKGAFPTHLSAIYQRPALDLGVYPWLFSLVLVGLGVWAWRASPRSRRGVVLSAGFFLVSIALVSGLIEITPRQFAADRYFYLPSIGFFLFLGLVVCEVSERVPGAERSKHLLLGSLGVAYCILLGVQSLDRMQIWSNCEALWQDAVRAYPRSNFAHYQLAGVYYRNEEYTNTVHHLEEALFWQPENAPAAYLLATTLGRLGDERGAEARFEQTIEMDPAAWWAHHDLGILLLRQRRWSAAAAHLERAYAAKPHLIFNCHFLGVAQRNMGENDRALQTFRRCLAIDPDHVDTLVELAHVHLARGKIGKALRALEAAKLRGHRPDPAFEARLRRGARALEEPEGGAP